MQLLPIDWNPEAKQVHEMFKLINVLIDLFVGDPGIGKTCSMAYLAFSVKSIVQCTVQYLQDDDLVNDFFYQASYSTATALLHIPILLLMLCAVFQEKESLPNSKTELYSDIFEVIMDRTTLKKLDSTSAELERVKDFTCKLGKISWEALQKNNLLLKKV